MAFNLNLLNLLRLSLSSLVLDLGLLGSSSRSSILLGFEHHVLVLFKQFFLLLNHQSLILVDLFLKLEALFSQSIFLLLLLCEELNLHLLHSLLLFELCKLGLVL